MADPPTLEIDDRPSMGDPETVEGLVRRMLFDANAIRQRYLAEDDPDAHVKAQAAILALVDEWTVKLSATNADYQQTMTPEAQDTWLRQHGLGSDDYAAGAPVKALVANTINEIIEAENAHATGLPDDDTKFRVQVAIEDCVDLLLGIDTEVEE